MHPTLRGLLDGIKASSEDDATRLVVADWLEENVRKTACKIRIGE
jgi:uncharacterized protein (TIGR02996 family)